MLNVSACTRESGMIVCCKTGNSKKSEVRREQSSRCRKEEEREGVGKRDEMQMRGGCGVRRQHETTGGR